MDRFSNIDFPRQIKPHWLAADTLDTFSIDALNNTFNSSIPDIPLLPDGPKPYKHTRLRFNDTLIHTPPLVMNAISNSILRYKPLWLMAG